jgi:hypothetical protein
MNYVFEAATNNHHHKLFLKCSLVEPQLSKLIFVSLQRRRGKANASLREWGKLERLVRSSLDNRRSTLGLRPLNRYYTL